MVCGHLAPLNIFHTISFLVCQVAVVEVQGPFPVPWVSFVVLVVLVVVQLSVVVNWTKVHLIVPLAYPVAIGSDESHTPFDPSQFSHFH